MRDSIQSNNTIVRLEKWHTSRTPIEKDYPTLKYTDKQTLLLSPQLLQKPRLLRQIRLLFNHCSERSAGGFVETVETGQFAPVFHNVEVVFAVVPDNFFAPQEIGHRVEVRIEEAEFVGFHVNFEQYRFGRQI